MKSNLTCNIFIYMYGIEDELLKLMVEEFFLNNCFIISCRTRLFVQGSIQYNNYVDQEGIKRYNTSIVPSKSSI